MPSGLPVIYSCSGCSNAAQLANALALQADRQGWASMSCISGIGGGVAPLLKLARQAPALVTIDGCALQCSVACLRQHGMAPDAQIVLSEQGVRKRGHTDFSPADVERLAPQIRALCQRAMTARKTASRAEC